MTRISVEEGDPAYFSGFGATVRLNGEIVDHVTTADEELGFLRRLKTTAKGELVLNSARSEVERETLFGKVTVELPEP